MPSLIATQVPDTAYGAPAQAEANVPNRGPITCFVDFSKGDATSLEMMVEYSSKFDTEGQESWHKETEFSAANPAVAALKERQFTVTGKYRFEIPNNPSGDKVRLSFKRTGGVAASVAEITDFLFSQAGSYYDVAGAAKALQLYDGEGNPHYFWFNVTDGGNTQDDPTLLGTGHQVDLVAADASTDVATKFAAVVDALDEFSAPVPGASTATVTNAVAGAVTDASDSGVAAAITVTTQGVSAATVTLGVSV